MGAPDFHEPRPGDPVRAQDEAEVRRYLKQIGNSFGASMGHAGPEGNQSGRFREMPWLRIVKITDVDCNFPWRHAWEEVISDPADDNAYDTLGNASSKNQSGGIDKWYLITPELTEYIPNDTVMLVTPFFNQDNELTFIGHFIHEPFWSKLTDTNDQDGEYSWTEQEPDGAGKLQDKVDGRTGTLNARDVNGEICIPTDTIVWMVFSEQLTCSSTPEDRYLFEYVPHLDSWFEIDSSPGNTGPVYTATFLDHDGAGNLEPDDPAVTTDFLREVNGVTDINLQSDRRVFGHFLGLSDDGDEGTFTKRFAFDRGGATGSGCTDVWKTLVPDTGDTLVAVGCNDTVQFEGAGGITVTGTIGAEPPFDKLTIDGSGIGGGVQFWARLDSKVSPGLNNYNYTKLNADLTVTVDTGTTLEVNNNFLINLNGSGSSTRPIVRVFADANGNNEHFEYQISIKVRLVTNAGAGTYTFQAVTVLGTDITGYVGTALEVNKHLFLPTDATLGSSNGLRVLLEGPEVGSIPEFTMPTARRQFWAELGARDCTVASGDVYLITPKRETTGATLVTDAQNTQATKAREVNGNQGADKMMANGSLVLVTELIDPNNAIDAEFNYYFDANITASWYEITANLGAGTYTAKLLGLDLAAVQTCAAADITNALTEKNAHQFVPIGSIVRATHDKIYSSVIAFSWLEKAGAEFGTVTNDGGVAGDAATNSTFTYEISDEKGAVVASLVAPEQARLVNTPYLAAGTGGRSNKCYYSVQGGTVTLMLVPGEVADNTPCPAP